MAVGKVVCSALIPFPSAVCGCGGGGGGPLATVHLTALTEAPQAALPDARVLIVASSAPTLTAKALSPEHDGCVAPQQR